MKRTPLRRFTPLRSRSAKRAKLYRQERVPLVARLLAERPWCEARLDACTRRAEEVHEVKSRARGGSIVDEANCVVLCHACHSWITQHPREARELGWLKSSWE